MEWLKISNILKVFFGIFALGGCVAGAAAPVTMPVWMLIGIIFLIRPTIHAQWSRYTIFMGIQCLLLATFGFLSWIDLLERSNIASASLSDSRNLFLLGLVLAALTWLSWRLAPTPDTSRAWRGASVALQILIAVSELGYIAYMVLLPPWKR